MSNTKSKVIVFKQDVKDYYEKNNITDQYFDDWPVDMIFGESFKDIGTALSDDPVLIIASNKLIKNKGTLDEFLLMLDTLIRFSGRENKPLIGIGFSPDTSAAEIKEMQKTPIAGVFPLDYNPEELKQGIWSFLDSKKCWPKHIIEQLPGQKQKNSKMKDIHLTPRQTQVLELIANRGLSNKQIAQVLKISESTVKIHVSAIMKAMCVRNRTQLALSAK